MVYQNKQRKKFCKFRKTLRGGEEVDRMSVHGPWVTGKPEKKKRTGGEGRNHLGKKQLGVVRRNSEKAGG